MLVEKSAKNFQDTILTKTKLQSKTEKQNQNFIRRQAIQPHSKMQKFRLSNLNQVSLVQTLLDIMIKHMSSFAENKNNNLINWNKIETLPHHWKKTDNSNVIHVAKCPCNFGND